MAVAHKYERSKEKKASVYDLADYLHYLEDEIDPDHKGITLLPGRNYHCSGPTNKDLIAGVLATQNAYLRHREGKSGKRTSDLWDEIIHNLGAGCFVTQDERDAIESKIIAEICPDAPARTTWHINEETGECDLHIVFAVKRPQGTLTLARTKIGLSKRLQALDQFAADLLNRSKSKPLRRIPHIKTAKEVAEEESKKRAKAREAARAKKENRKPSQKCAPQTLAEQVAAQAESEGIDDVEAHHLPGLLERIGIKIKKVVAGIIHYTPSRTKRQGMVRVPTTGIIRIEDFLFKIFSAQIKLRALAKANPNPNIKAEKAEISNPKSNIAKPKTPDKTPDKPDID